MGAPRTPKGRAREVAKRLEAAYPEAICELDHRNAFELLAATILSAQCTDARVNAVTPHLFAAYPNAPALAAADPTAVEEIVRTTGFYAAKTRSLIGMANGLVDRFEGDVPTSLDDLLTLPGVGRKTANLIRAVAFDLPGLPVDTHVGRVVRRLGLTAEDDATKVEFALCALLPPPTWGGFGLRSILHGRRICDARTPRCASCNLEDLCPSSTLPKRSRPALV